MSKKRGKSKRLCKTSSQKETEYFKIPEIIKEKLLEKRDARTVVVTFASPLKLEWIWKGQVNDQQVRGRLINIC